MLLQTKYEFMVDTDEDFTAFFNPQVRKLYTSGRFALTMTLRVGIFD